MCQAKPAAVWRWREMKFLEKNVGLSVTLNFNVSAQYKVLAPCFAQYVLFKVVCIACIGLSFNCSVYVVVSQAMWSRPRAVSCKR